MNFAAREAENVVYVLSSPRLSFNSIIMEGENGCWGITRGSATVSPPAPETVFPLWQSLICTAIYSLIFLRQDGLGGQVVAGTSFGNGERVVGIWGYLKMLGASKDKFSLLDWPATRLLRVQTGFSETSSPSPVISKALHLSSPHFPLL